MKTKKFSNFAYFLIILAGVSGCATMHPIATVSAVSMTPGAERFSSAKEIGPINARYCQGEDASTEHGGTVGLMDEVTMKAQKESGANYIRQAVFSSDGRCIELEGIAMK